MLSVNNQMQFNHLESTIPSSGKSWSQRDRRIIIVLLLFEHLNKQAFNLWKKSLDNLSPQGVTPQS